MAVSQTARHWRRPSERQVIITKLHQSQANIFMSSSLIQSGRKSFQDPPLAPTLFEEWGILLNYDGQGKKSQKLLISNDWSKNCFSYATVSRYPDS